VSSKKKPLTNRHRTRHRTNNPENLEDSRGFIELFNQFNEEQKKEIITRLQKHPHIHSISQFLGGPIPPPVALGTQKKIIIQNR